MINFLLAAQKDVESWKAVSRYAQKAVFVDPNDIQSLNLLAKVWLNTVTNFLRAPTQNRLSVCVRLYVCPFIPTQILIYSNWLYCFDGYLKFHLHCFLLRTTIYIKFVHFNYSGQVRAGRYRRSKKTHHSSDQHRKSSQTRRRTKGRERDEGTYGQN